MSKFTYLERGNNEAVYLSKHVVKAFGKSSGGGFNNKKSHPPPFLRNGVIVFRLFIFSN